MKPAPANTNHSPAASQPQLDPNHFRYLMDAQNEVWKGPLHLGSPHHNLHYAKFEGYDARWRAIWVLRRTDPPPDSRELTIQESIEFFRTELLKKLSQIKTTVTPK